MAKKTAKELYEELSAEFSPSYAKVVRAALYAVVPGTQRARVEQWQLTLSAGYRAALRTLAKQRRDRSI